MKTDELAQLHKALSIPVRLKILDLVGERSLCVNAITRYLEISQPAVSQHLAVLKHAGLVNSTKHGYMVHYSLDRERLQEFRQAMDHFAKERAEEERTLTSGNTKKSPLPMGPE
jgi:DNA-binding transcriptional ArsR family regulator